MLATALLGLAVAGCGGAGKGTGSSSPVTHGAASGDAAVAPASSSARSGSYLKGDGDDDNDDQPHHTKAETDERAILTAYGGKVRPADARAITTLVKSYYAASFADDGARACSLLYASLAAGLVAEQSQSAQGPHTCTRAMSLLLEQQHGRLATEHVSTMTIIGVHVQGDLGLAVLGFKTAPESQLVVEREGHAWKVDALIDSYMP